MRHRFPLAAALLALAACATHPDPKLADCDGKHRRPANPYGSVLPSAPDVASPAAAPAPSLTLPAPLSQVDSRSFAPCGARA